MTDALKVFETFSPNCASRAFGWNEEAAFCVERNTGENSMDHLGVCCYSKCPRLEEK